MRDPVARTCLACLITHWGSYSTTTRMVQQPRKFEDFRPHCLISIIAGSSVTLVDSARARRNEN